MTADLAPAIGANARYYSRDGLPILGVPNKSKPGELRPVNATDAKKAGWLPSVTTIINSTLAKPGLVQWQLGHMLRASQTLPVILGETADERAARIIEDYERYPAEARDTGSAIHAAISQWLQGAAGPVYLALQPVLHAFIAWYNAQGFVHDHTEKAVVNLEHGYAGTLDWAGQWNGKRTYIDFKTVDTEPVFYNENAMQIAAYAKADGHLEDSQLVNVALSRTRPGVIGVKVWGENERHFARFHALLNYWKCTHSWGIE